MPLRDAPYILSGGMLRDVGDIIIHPTNARQAMRAIMQVGLRSDFARGLARDYPQNIQAIGRSGHSRCGLDVEFEEGQTPQISKSGNTAEVPVLLSSLRGAKDDQLLTILKGIVEEERSQHFEIGRLLISQPESALDSKAVLEECHQGHILLSKNATIAEDGTIELPLEELQFLFCEANFNRYRSIVRDVLLHGKHVYDGIQEEVPGLPAAIEPGGFFVGGIRIAFGNYMAVIERETTHKTTFHLAARILDGMRTTGIHVPRQVELYNCGDKPADTRDLKVRIRIYPIPVDQRSKVDQFNHPDKIKDGIEFRDIARLEEEPERILSVMRNIEPVSKPDTLYALVLAGNRVAKVKWQELPSFTDRHAVECAKRLVAAEKGHYIEGEAIDENLLWLTKVLNFVGGEQNEGKVFASYAFPSPEILQNLLRNGIAVFIAHDLNRATDAFDPTAEINGRRKTNDLNFSSTQYEQFRALERQGARLHMALHENADPNAPSGKIDAHAREFFRGFWVRPEASEKMKKVDTIVAIYGSHVDGLDDILKKQLNRFLTRMKTAFGETFAITHGKGPGVMQIADDLAASLDIFRFGVGIDLEQKKRQKPNYAPPAIIDFKDTERLRRQKVMDDIATFKIFNIGGAGTLEEAAISICSQKLSKNIITPIIFVDPVHLNEGEHLWGNLQKQIEVLATEHSITPEGALVGLENVRLLQSYAADYCHFVRTYDEAADIIEKFVQDPMAYYQEKGVSREDIVLSIGNAHSTREMTDFPLPEWFNEKEIRKACES